MPHRLTNRVADGDFTRSEAFDPTKRSIAFKTILANSLVVGEEATASLQAVSHLSSLQLRQAVPSGFLGKGSLVFGSNPNAYAIDSGIPATPIPAVINGHLVFLGGASTGGGDPHGYGSNNDRYSQIMLPAPPSADAREDFVFLEVWYAELDDQDTYYPWGCVQYLGDPLANDIKNSAFGELYNKDVVLRWQIRIVSDVDFPANPWGLGAANVPARAGGASSAYTFSNMGSVNGDYGLWRAGDGDDASRTTLACTDGYAYAIPMQRVHRRNTGAWTTANPNGSSVALGGSSDRPDGLFNDEVDERDVQDLRLQISLLGLDYSLELEKFADKLLANEARIPIKTDENDPDVKGRVILFAEGISVSDQTGVDDRFQPDAIRRVFNDAGVTQATLGYLSNGSGDDADLGGHLTLTDASDTVTITAPPTPSGVVVGETVPTMKWVGNGTAVAISGSWSGLGTGTATATLDSGDGNYQAGGEFYVEFELEYPAHEGLRHLPEQVFRADIDGVGMYVATSVADLNLTNLAGNGDYGISFTYATRAITEIARRESVIANGNGVARSSGKTLAASAGAIDGGLVTGLTPSQAVDVVYACTPATNEQIRIFYDYVPFQGPALPATLNVEILHLSDFIQISNLGSGGGTDGQPYTHPVLHIPENNGSLPRDSYLGNNADLETGIFGTNTGLMRLPVLFKDAFRTVVALNSPGTDSEGRAFYAGANVDMVCQTGDLTSVQWHRSMLWGLARVTATSGEFLGNELVALCFTDSTDGKANRAGVAAGETLCVAVFKLNRIVR